jgi:hypothetical protein
MQGVIEMVVNKELQVEPPPLRRQSTMASVRTEMDRDLSD